ncbi:MAG: glycosyltransferase family 4 protein [Anaerolineales bacterium]|nr:glycosyltransferase family 4 protein [Anaerolineales bacterium]
MSVKIAYILKMFPRFSETFIVNEILELERQGAEIRIYSLLKPDDGRFHASLARVKANVIYVPQYPEMEPERIKLAHQRLRRAVPENYEAVRSYTEAKNAPYAIKRFLQAGFVADHLLQNPVDAVHAHFGSSAARTANLVNRLIGVPYSFTAHAKDIYHEAVNPASLRSKILGARFVVTVSQYNVAYLQEMVADPAADIRRLYNGIDLSYFRPNGKNRKGKFRMLAVGRLVEKKGFADLIRACALLTEQGIAYRCDIIGKGPEEANLAALIEELGLSEQVRLKGPRAQDGVRKAYRKADLFVLPCVIGSDNNQDGLPTVLLEAMACGLPVVSTRLTGIPEMITDGQEGRLVDPGDVAALAQALGELAADATLRERMSAAARATTERKFDVRQNVAQLLQWFEEPRQELPLPINLTDLIQLEPSLPLVAPMALQEVMATL